jgi:hypothetical protein
VTWSWSAGENGVQYGMNRGGAEVIFLRNAPKGHTVSSRGCQPAESEHTPHHTRTLKGPPRYELYDPFRVVSK